jgi:CRISPR-associated protein Cas2
MKNRLSNMIDPKTDSLRFYLLGNNYQERIEHVGARPSYDPEQTMII